MAYRYRLDLDGLILNVCFTEAADGDFQVLDPAPDLDVRRRAIVDAPWSWLRQVHGDRVVEVTVPGEHAGEDADGLVTAAIGAPISVTTADCAPLVLVAERGVAMVHAGWRGLVDGVVERGAELLRTVAGRPVAALVGPCIRPAAYRFDRPELDRVIGRFDASVESTTAHGEPALDMPRAVALACESAGFPAPEPAPCTSERRFFSHRTRADQARQVAVVWLDVAPHRAFSGSR